MGAGAELLCTCAERIIRDYGGQQALTQQLNVDATLSGAAARQAAEAAAGAGHAAEHQAAAAAAAALQQLHCWSRLLRGLHLAWHPEHLWAGAPAGRLQQL